MSDTLRFCRRAPRASALRGGVSHLAALRSRAASRTRRSGDAGMATAEYAVATLAACGFAGLLVAILSGGEVREMLLSVVQRALSLG